MSSGRLCWTTRVAVLLLGATFAGHARAVGSKAQCIAAYEEGQRLQLDQSFTLAAERFAFCSSAECPAAMHQECSTLLASVQAATPALVFLVLDDSGAPLQHVRIAIDEGPPQALTAEPLSLDPGEYQFTFEAEGYASVSRKVSVSGAGKTQIEVHVKRQRSSAQRTVHPTPEKPNGGVRTALLVGTSAVSVLGGAGFAYFGLNARSGDHDLDGCTPNCSAEAVADVRRNYLLANTSLVVGLAGLVGAAVVWFTTGQPATAEPSHLSSTTWDVQLGMISTVSAAF